MLIDIILASRGRPKRLLEMLESAHATADRPDEYRVMVRLDDDDAFLPEYQSLNGKFGKAIYILGRKEKVPKLIGELSMKSTAPIQVHAADDVRFASKGWDRRAREVVSTWHDGMGVAYTNDGLGRRKCQHFICTRRWMDVVGTEGWTELRHFGLDEWHEKIAEAVGRLVYLGDVVLEHLHMKHRYPDGTPKAERDETYAEKRVENWSGADAIDFVSMAAIRERQIGRVRACINGSA